MTRAEHLAWCKKRALAEMDHGTPANAWASMASDMSKHDETRDHLALSLGNVMFLTGQLDTPAKMRDFIEGFN